MPQHVRVDMNALAAGRRKALKTLLNAAWAETSSTRGDEDRGLTQCRQSLALIEPGSQRALCHPTDRHDPRVPALARNSDQAVTQVEIDQAVIDMSKTYLPKHSNGAFDDPRTHIVIDDGLAFVRETEDRFDVIISDSTDPIGPGEVLFTEDFYAQCQRCLNPGGILVTQNGVAFMQLDEVQGTAKRFSQRFADWGFFSAAVPTYVGGIMAFAWGTDDLTHRNQSLETIQQRYKALDLQTRYYTPAIHLASFALPRYLESAIAEAVSA